MAFFCKKYVGTGKKLCASKCIEDKRKLFSIKPERIEWMKRKVNICCLKRIEPGV